MTSPSINLGWSACRPSISPVGGAAILFFLLVALTAFLLFHDGEAAFLSQRLQWLFASLSGVYALLAVLFFLFRRHSRQALTRVYTLTDILGSLRDMVFIFSPETLELRYVNQAASDLTRLDADGLGQRSLAEFLPSFGREGLGKLIEPLTADPGYSLLFETECRVGERTVPVEIQLQCVADGKRSVDCVAVVRDISVREQSLRMLQDAQERFRNIFLTGPDPISISTLDGVFVEVNARFCELSGYSAQELVGRSSTELGIWKDPERDRRRMIELLGEHNRIRNFEAEFITKAGDLIIGLVSASLLNLEGVPHLLVSVRNITELRRMEADRVELEQQLNRTRNLESLASLTGGMAHEFNNLLTSIIGYADLALDELPAESQPAEDLRRLLVKAGEAEDLISQFMLFSHRQPGEKTALELEPLVRELIRHVEGLPSRTLVVEPRIEPGCGPVFADPVKLQQALMHIVTNAVEAMDGSGKLIVGLKPLSTSGRMDVRFPELGPGEHVHLYFKDMGQGMDPLTLERVFDPFFSTKGVGAATGMGMSVVHGIVADHQGSIRVNSRKGYGSTVHIVFPVHQAGQEAEQPARSGRGNEHILMVDDDTMLPTLVARFLEPLGYRVTGCANGSQALAYLASGHVVHLVLTDFRMPGMDGLELIDTLRGAYPRLPVLLLSGRQDDFDHDEAKQRGAWGILEKPLRREDLVERIRATLDFAARIPADGDEQGMTCIH